jgi:hypothetical protein
VKKTHFPCYAVTLALLCAPSLLAEEAVPKPDDFAGALTLTGTGGSILKIEIPEAVYRGLERPDRGDMRVFDANGTMAPFTVRAVPGRVEVPAPLEVPFFYWEEEQGRSLPEGTGIDLDPPGTVLRIKTRTAPESAAPSEYLLDLSGLGYPPAALDLDMAAEGFYNAGVSLFSSNDLNNWNAFEKSQTLAWYGDSGASKTRIELPPESSRYVLLRFSRGEIKPRRILALFNEAEVPPPPRETRIPGEFQKGGRVIGYRIEGFYPLVSIHWTLAETDSVDARIKKRFSAKDEWETVSAFTFYRLGSAGGGFLYNRPLKTRSAAPFWELEVQGESAFASAPECRIQWAPQELLFLARGTGPWTLAYGNRNWGQPASGGLRLDEYPAGADSQITDAGISGEPRYLARADSSRSGRRDWGQWLLWAILVAAVAALLFLAYKTAKSMSKEK